MRPTSMVGLGWMAGRWGRGVVLAGVCWLGALAAAQSGGATAKDASCVPATDTKAKGGKVDAAKPVEGSKACPTEEHVPSVAEQFPFPGEAPVTPAAAKSAQPGDGKTVKDQFPYPGEAPVSAPKAGGAVDRFPYPGEAAAPSGGDGSSSSSSSSGMGTTDGEGKPAFKDEGSEGEAQPQHRRRLRPQAQKTLSDDERVEEDLSVAHFYQQSGNTMGAYLRAKDAVKLQPGAADTHLALAEAAEKLGKREEAVAEYTAALAAEPDGEGAKGARKALERLKR